MKVRELIYFPLYTTKILDSQISIIRFCVSMKKLKEYSLHASMWLPV
jgi:hypothetical protein